MPNDTETEKKSLANINIRLAQRKDCPQLMMLIRELATYERAPEEVTVDERHFEETGFGAQPVWWAIVAEHTGGEPKGAENEEKIVGFALCYTRYSTWKGSLCYLEDLVVTDSFRGHGIGRMLFEEVLLHAKIKGCPRVCWQVLDWNEPALNFYRKFGSSFDASWVNGWVSTGSKA